MLYLLRHAESDRSNLMVPDYDRPLSAAGAAAARQIGRAMQARGWLPEAVLCSAARRAVETWEVVAAELKAPIPAKARRDLYLASASRLISVLRRQPDGPASILLIGHNPGIGDLATALSGPGSAAAAKSRLRHGYPTAAIAVIALPIDEWQAIRPYGGRLLHVAYPDDPA